MVFVIFTDKGLEDAVRVPIKPTELWLNEGVGTKERISELRADGWKITTWANRFDPNDFEQLVSALWTVREHHPGETIWFQDFDVHPGNPADAATERPHR